MWVVVEVGVFVVDWVIGVVLEPVLVMVREPARVMLLSSVTVLDV